MAAAIDTPLGELFDGRRLRDLAPTDRLAELTFDLTFDPVRVMAAEIGAVLAGTLAPNDPLRPYGDELASALAVTELAGWLTGSIDAVFRVGDGEPRFVVVDYKSNRLHEPGAADPLAAYRPDLLTAAMTHSHYPLQAVLYCVALHRYLRWRLGSRYDPERHLGGVAYLFVRGMVGPTTADPRRRLLWRVLVAPTGGHRARPRRALSWWTLMRATERQRGAARSGLRGRGTQCPSASPLQPWIDAGVLGAAEVHTAAVVAELVTAEPAAADVVLAVALAVWAPQHGHACIDLDTIAADVDAELALAAAEGDRRRRRSATASVAGTGRVARRRQRQRGRPRGVGGGRRSRPRRAAGGAVRPSPLHPAAVGRRVRRRRGGPAPSGGGASVDDLDVGTRPPAPAARRRRGEPAAHGRRRSPPQPRSP